MKNGRVTIRIAFVNLEQDLETFTQHKGKQYCFISAIISADDTIPDNQKIEHYKAGFMDRTLDKTIEESDIYPKENDRHILALIVT